MPLEIRGLGTPDIESFPSYLHRLACMHEVTVAALLRRVTAWYQEKYPQKKICFSKPGSAGDLSVFVRPNQGTNDLVQMFSEAVGNYDLKGTTFLALNEVIVRTAKIFSKKMRWCPFCMKKSEINKDSGYFKLMWAVESITYCPQHNARLRDSCPCCGKSQGGYGYKVEPGKCQECGSYLSQINPDDTKFKASWDAQGADMLRLVEYISKHPQTVFIGNGVKKVISREFDKAWHSNTEMEFWKIIPKNECLGIVQGYLPITLKRARIIAHRFGVDLIDLLHGDISKSPAMLDPQWSFKLPPDIRPVKKKKNSKRDHILDNIHNHMKRQKNKPRPLRYYADAVGVSTGYINYNFPVLSRRIITVHKAWKEEEKARKQREAYNQALKLIINHEGNPAEFSKKGALRKIRKKTYLPKEVVRKAINDVHRLVVEGAI